MRIHSSSLTLTPANFNQQPIGKQSSAQNKNEKKEPLFATDTHDNDQPLFPTYSSEEIRQAIDTAELAFHLIDKETADTPRNARTLRALTAYNQELNKPLLDQRARAIKGIDTYA